MKTGIRALSVTIQFEHREREDGQSLMSVARLGRRKRSLLAQNVTAFRTRFDGRADDVVVIEMLLLLLRGGRIVDGRRCRPHGPPLWLYSCFGTQFKVGFTVFISLNLLVAVGGRFKIVTAAAALTVTIVTAFRIGRLLRALSTVAERPIALFRPACFVRCRRTVIVRSRRGGVGCVLNVRSGTAADALESIRQGLGGRRHHGRQVLVDALIGVDLTSAGEG